MKNISDKSPWIEIMTGASVLLFALLFMVYALNKTGMGKSAGYDYKAYFDRVDGLQVGHDVRLSGVKVGEVTAITINPKTYLAKVSLSVQKDLELPLDSSAEITTEGLLGNKYVALVPGGDEKNLNPGDTFRHTQSSVSLEAMIGQLIFSQKSGATHD